MSLKTFATKTRPIYLAIATMAALATAWMSYEFWRLLWQPLAENGAVDLLYRYSEVTSFARGIPVYWELSDAVYPPASYLMMWPLIGWLPAAAVRPVWAVTTVGCLIVLTVQIFRIVQTKPHSLHLIHKVFLTLLPLCLYATGATIGNGQIVIHLLACLLGSLLCLQQINKNAKNTASRIGWTLPVITAMLMLLALVKPNITAPFFWILLFRAPLTAALSAGMYGALTVASALLQPEFDGPVHLFKGWLNMGMAGVYYGATPYVEYEGGGSIETTVNAHSVLGFFNFDQLDFIEFSGWNQSVSLAALLVLGIWIYRQRKADIWLLASVAAVISKYWTYHGWYDDLVLLIPLIVLFKISQWDAKPHASSHHTLARALFIALFLVMLAPGGVYLLPQLWRFVYLAVQTLIIFATLAFCIRETHPKKSAKLASL